jgi:hypothetical protein
VSIPVTAGAAFGDFRFPEKRPLAERVGESSDGEPDLGYPSHRIAIVLEALGILQRVLAGVHHQVPVIVAFLRGMHGVERYRHVGA